ncbi:hypothetical protein CTI12_AA463790 [Artemisia annua]|uniref:Uncharacterized protein n=1 Tax=Artemisia annua TaxID=35608 RepID=A0A2U1LQ23_ARTAN|nr:hypothetical protein CTI12_AA463790 [Artemisia annua]
MPFCTILLIDLTGIEYLRLACACIFALNIYQVFADGNSLGLALGSQSPNDEEGDPPSVEGNRRAASDDCEVTVEDEAVTIATQMGENGVTSEGINLQNQNGEGPSNTEEEPQTEFRRSTRHKSQPIRFNDYIVSSSSRYGLEKFYMCVILAFYKLYMCMVLIAFLYVYRNRFDPAVELGAIDLSIN